MKAIVPLAGPDFVRPDGSLKATIPTKRGPLLHSILSGRAWSHALSPIDYTFIFVDRPETREFIANDLAEWFPGAQKVLFSRCTQGAALTCAAGAASLSDLTAPLVLDLADIDFACDRFDAAEKFRRSPKLGGIALTFVSDNPAYSYLRRDDTGRVVEAAEKRMISQEASAGVYFFRNPAILLGAVAHALENAAEQTHQGLFFVCPLFNGVIAQGLNVETVPVRNVDDIKMWAPS